MYPHKTIRDLKIERNEEQKKHFRTLCILVLFFILLIITCCLIDTYYIGRGVVIFLLVAPFWAYFAQSYHDLSLEPTIEQLNEYNRRNTPFSMTIDKDKDNEEV